MTDKELAEAHWAYTETIILMMLGVAKFLYIEAMLHGIKHGKEDGK